MPHSKPKLYLTLALLATSAMGCPKTDPPPLVDLADADAALDADAATPDAPDVPLAGPVVRGGIAPSGVHATATVRVHGSLSLA